MKLSDADQAERNLRLVNRWDKQLKDLAVLENGLMGVPEAHIDPLGGDCLRLCFADGDYHLSDEMFLVPLCHEFVASCLAAVRSEMESKKEAIARLAPNLVSK